MLTSISYDLIYHFLGKSNINHLSRSKVFKSLYEYLNTNNKYTNSKINIKISKSKPVNKLFTAKNIVNKLELIDNVIVLEWITYGQSKVINKLHIYIDFKDGKTEPDMKLLIDSISFITSFSDKDRKINIHLCLLSDKKNLKKCKAINKCKC